MYSMWEKQKPESSQEVINLSLISLWSGTLSLNRTENCTTFNSFSRIALMCFRSADSTNYKVCELFCVDNHISHLDIIYLVQKLNWQLFVVLLNKSKYD